MASLTPAIHVCIKFKGRVRVRNSRDRAPSAFLSGWHGLDLQPHRPGHVYNVTHGAVSAISCNILLCNFSSRQRIRINGNSLRHIPMQDGLHLLLYIWRPWSICRVRTEQLYSLMHEHFTAIPLGGRPVGDFRYWLTELLDFRREVVAPRFGSSSNQAMSQLQTHPLSFKFPPFSTHTRTVSSCSPYYAAYKALGRHPSGV